MKLNRRTFFKVAGAAGAVALAPAKSATASTAAASLDANRRGVLVDTTKCIGCRACEAACAEANTLPGPAMLDDAAVFASPRKTDTTSFTVVNRAAGVHPGALRQAPVHALRRARLRVGVPGAGARQDAHRAGGVPQGPLPRLPLLHGRLPVRRAQVRIRLGAALREEVHLLRRPPGQGRGAGLHVGLPERRAHVRQSQRAARHRPRAPLRARTAPTCATSSASTRSAAPAGCTSPTSPSTSWACPPNWAPTPTRRSPRPRSPPCPSC